MSVVRRALCGSAIALCAGWFAAHGEPRVAAQELPGQQNPYARKSARGPKPFVHPSLVKALHNKVAQCFELEQGKPLAAEQELLLRTFGASVVRDLQPGFASTTCQLGKPTELACLGELEALPCERLAEPIVAAGWDRNLSEETRAQVAQYAAALVKRQAGCGFLEDEPIRLGIQSDRISVLIESNIVMGKCEFHPELRAQCDQQLAAIPCKQLAALEERGEVVQACSGLMRCVTTPDPNKH